MSWLKTILFAVLTGVYTGIVMLFPALESTSFQDIGIGYEWWIIFAVIVVVNCEKNWEAMLKCFVFFLISQPLVYLVQVACGTLSMDMARYYYFGIWFKVTFLTLPGGFIAYYCKKQNILRGIVMGLGNAMEMFMCFSYLVEMKGHFPHHLLSAVVSFAAIVVMTLCIQKEKKNRIIAFAIPVAAMAALIAFY